MEISPQILSKIRELELRTKRNVSTLLSGNYRSAFRGSGMQFKEFRHYEPGDDIRHMAWGVTARTGRATIKTFEEDRELNVLLMVDVSGSSLFGRPEKRKVDMYSDLVALIGLTAVKSKDNVSLLPFHDQPLDYLPPKDTQNHILRGVAQVLASPLEGKKSDLRPALFYAANILKTRTLVIVISDFMLPQFETELALLSKRHDVILLHCHDDAERGSLQKSIFEVWDPETNEFYIVDSHSHELCQALAEQHVNLRNGLEDTCHRVGADYLNLSVEDDYLQRLVHFFRRRGPSHV